MDADDKTSKVNLNTTSASTKSKTLVSKEEKTYPLEIRDLKQIPKEKVIAARIGADSDTYLHYAISKRRRDLLIFLLENVAEIPLDSKNSQGQTPLHLAIKSGYITMLKALCVADFSNIEEVLKTSDVTDIRGNINPKLTKLFAMQNSKGMTPLHTAVEC